MFADILKELRKAKNVKQDDLANLLNIKRQTYSAYERGVSTPDIYTLGKLADYFNVSTDFMLGREDNISMDILKYYNNISAIGKTKVCEYAEMVYKTENM